MKRRRKREEVGKGKRESDEYERPTQPTWRELLVQVHSNPPCWLFHVTSRLCSFLFWCLFSLHLSSSSSSFFFFSPLIFSPRPSALQLRALCANRRSTNSTNRNHNSSSSVQKSTKARKEETQAQVQAEEEEAGGIEEGGDGVASLHSGAIARNGRRTTRGSRGKPPTRQEQTERKW